MSLTFRITTTWLEHTTKFYQLFRIERFDNGRFSGRESAVGHYGSKNVLRGNGPLYRPIQGGQCAVYAGTSHDDKRSEKLRKGYRIENAPIITDLESEEAFRSWLLRQMKDGDRTRVLGYLGMSLNPNAAPIDPDDQPTDDGETATSAPTARPDGWGDW